MKKAKVGVAVGSGSDYSVSLSGYDYLLMTKPHPANGGVDDDVIGWRITYALSFQILKRTHFHPLKK